MENTEKVIILGSGPAGLTAAIYAARAMLNPVLITGSQKGGQLTITTDVENYPGFADPIQGPWLMEQMTQQALNVGTRIVEDTIISADLSGKILSLQGADTTYNTHSLIIATGASAKWLGLPSEQKFQGFGVSACATCDGFFYRNRVVCVVGGGNTAVEEALFLTNFASKVYVIHRRDSLRAEPILQDRLFKNPKVEMLWNREVDEILGTEDPLSVTGIRLKNNQTGQLETIDTHGVFIAIGHAPATSLFTSQLDHDESGYLTVKPFSTHTSLEGVFAAGDVTDSIYRQAITAAGMGCMAALDAQRYLSEILA